MQLNQEQRAAVDHIDGPLLILAGAGTGKTRVIVEKVGRLLECVPDLRPESILALTFSNKAAREMAERAAERFGPRARKSRFTTFHSFCNRLLAEEKRWKAVDEIDHWIFLRRNLESLGLDRFLHVSDPGHFLDDLLEFCSRCHDNLVSPEKFTSYVEKLALETPAPPASKKKPKLSPADEVARLREVARVYACSEELQQQAEIVSFGAMLSRAASLLEASKDLQERLRRRYRYILVDEFQDTNWAQIRLLQLLAGERHNIAAVGDPNQAIYHFRGASYTSFELFEKSFPGCKRVLLTENYRSTKRILAVAAAVIASAPAPPGAPPVKPLTTQNNDGARVAVAEYCSEDEQAEDVAREIVRKMAEGDAARFDEFAVLYRKHGHRNRLVAALRKHEIPFSIRRLAINTHPTVKAMLATLRAIGDVYDSVSMLRFLLLPQWSVPLPTLSSLCHKARSQHQGLSEFLADTGDSQQPSTEDAGVGHALAFLKRYRETAEGHAISEWLGHLRDELGFFQPPEELPVWDAFSKFVERWDKEKSATHRLREFLEYFELFEEARGTINLDDDEEDLFDEKAAVLPASQRAALPAEVSQQGLLPFEQDAPDDPLGRVQLLTIHAAKGLEFDHVFLLTVVNGQFPSRRRHPLISYPNELVAGPEPKGDVHKDEERRLFYVALTRAKKTLTLCTIANPKQKPSEFLEHLRSGGLDALAWAPRPRWNTVLTHGNDLPEFLTRPGSPKPPQDLTLSDSSIESYQLCPTKYYFQSVWQVPFTPSPALRFGSIMHAALRKAIEVLAHKPELLDAARIEEILRAEWQENAFVEAAQERKYWQIGLTQLEGLRSAALARPFQLLHQEKAFQFPVAGIKLIGRIDQINALTEKRVELIEYKTGRPKTQKDADESLQLTIYARACREVFGLDPAELVLLNLETGERLHTKRDESHFLELDRIVQETGRSVNSGQFRPSPGFHCKFCDFRTICSADEIS